MKPEWKGIIEELTSKGVDHGDILKVLKENRRHSDFSASGSERWINCSGSVQLSRKCPKQPDSFHAVEGSVAHYYLEQWIKTYVKTGKLNLVPKKLYLGYKDMYEAVAKSMKFIASKWDKETEILTPESRISLEFIHEDTFGTGDIRIYDPVFRRLKFYDYKHGKGHIVEIVENDGKVIKLNSQLAFYALGAAYDIGYENIDEVEIGIIQPRASHVDGFFRIKEVSIKSLMKYEGIFRLAITKALSKNPPFKEGKWCHWCPAKDICPLKEKQKLDKVANYF